VAEWNKDPRRYIPEPSVPVLLPSGNGFVS
jgi:hypothetical protein